MEPTDLAINTDNFGLATDLYELTMATAYFRSGQADRKAVFEVFVRKLPRNRSYMVFAGLEQVIHYILNLKFADDNIRYLKSLKVFQSAGNDFFEYLRHFRFTGDVWAADEGTVLFPNEPFIRVEAPIIEAQILETYLLSMTNFQSLIATKASRIVNAAAGRDVVEFGFRRAHGPQAALLAARASYVGGCTGTSNSLAAKKLGISVFGTMAHSYVMSFDDETDAFKQFVNVFPEGLLLVDTYDTIGAVENIIKSGIRARGIRLDSGDLYSLSIKSRRILDGAGYHDAKIMASGDLNEYMIRDLVSKGAPIDIFGVGTELTTSRDDPAMNGVYKLVAIRIPEDGSEKMLYKVKTSPGKKTYPGPKQVYRILENNTLRSDMVVMEDESPPEGSIPLLKQYLEHGSLTRELPSLRDIRDFHRNQVKSLPRIFVDITNAPESFPVRFSDKIEELGYQSKIS